MTEMKTTTSVERAAAVLAESDESAIERAARLLELQQAAPLRAEPANVALSDVENAVSPIRPDEPARPDGFGSRRVEIAFERLAERGILSPLGEKTRTAEEFRLVKRRVLAGALGRDGQAVERGNLVMVTSAKPREGKTFTAINLAISIALEKDVHVLLVDADLVRPTVLRNFGLTAERGLVELLEDPQMQVGDVMLRTNIDKLSLLPAGSFHHMAPELLASERMRALMDELASRYHDRVIIFDTPPLLATSEPTVLARQVGQIVFVVESERTSEVAVRTALGLIADCPEVAMVLNKSRSVLGGHSFGSYYSYYGRGRASR